MFKTKKQQTATEGAYGSHEVARIANVSLRQLQWWDERKVVMPSHEGHRRVYSRGDALEITIISELRRKGFSLQKIRRVLRFVQREVGKRLGEIEVGENPSLQLMTDGKSVYLEDQHERIIDILKNAAQPMFVVCVSDQVRRLDGITPRKGAGSESVARRAAAKTA